MVLAAFGMAPVFAVANAYGAGVTDWDQARLPPGSGTAPHPLTPPPLTACAGAQASLFGKLGIFAFAAWGGAQGGGVIAGLAVCGVLLSVTSAASGARAGRTVRSEAAHALFERARAPRCPGLDVAARHGRRAHGRFPDRLDHADVPAVHVCGAGHRLPGAKLFVPTPC